MKTRIGTVFAFLVIASFMIAHVPAYGVHSDDPTVSVPDGTSICTENVEECFTPNRLSVAPGTTVTWSNDDASTPIHTVTSGVITDDTPGSEFDTDFSFATGTTFEHTFDEEGEYPYFCLLHPAMAGTIIVEAAHDDDHGDTMGGDNMPSDGEQEMIETPIMDDTDMEPMMDTDTMMDGTMGGMEMMMTEDGEIMVQVRAMSDPTAGQPLDIQLMFTDADGNELEHVNYEVLVTQGTSRVASDNAGHSHAGTEMVRTRTLETSDPVDVKVTLQGMGLPGTALADRTGPIGETIEFANVPEFGTIAAMILVVAIVSIIAVTSRSSVFPRI